MNTNKNYVIFFPEEITNSRYIFKFLFVEKPQIIIEMHLVSLNPTFQILHLKLFMKTLNIVYYRQL